ncbi:globin domain protein [Ruegeria pomeroyi]|uniref:Globin domain-containing protein n=1 Tax=Ruegeria alba TaxID=2916756 RepID=A0ABS9NUQ6_9RHOB|nr:globin domain-containing protein [Ruegeria alba]MCE8512496.1 globin domain protein [Ruegeria pomeroyi]MCE8521625.1 globin domain protein [Ruegeria pomeroyi]MCE8525277.1 globin domain protein [Ruegeria pomeroyi]MCE8529309.1 globin domain protein [Ruegeria pomeroyi]MCE8547620.1 globin domain protein [Ruegeria pomeroyi]
MTDDQIRLVHSSFARVFARKAELTERFYHHLFRELPDSRRLFKGDFPAQKEMFASMLAATVRGMSDAKSFQLLGRGLARSHARFNLNHADLKKAARALQTALSDVMGDALSPEETAAWNEAVAQLMEMLAAPA